MSALIGILGLGLLALILWDAFETIILPRRVTRRFRLARAFYRHTWTPWSRMARRMRSAKVHDSFLSYFGPLSLLGLFALWAVGLVFGFAMLQRAGGSMIEAPGHARNFRTDLYFSGTTFFTLGLGDVAPRGPLARFITVAEAGTGFGFLAIVISYLPVLYGAFSTREVNISLLDARAGSPPTAAELLRRHAQLHNPEALREYLADWEIWAAQLMESHLSYPVLCFFRSQHNNQSWLAAVTTILDTCALLLACAEESTLHWQARLTFAISRHALVDLSQVLNATPHPSRRDRLPEGDLARLREILAEAGVLVCGVRSADEKLHHLRQMYEPYANGLAARLLVPLPPWMASSEAVDNWRASAWGRTGAEVGLAPASKADGEHF